MPVDGVARKTQEDHLKKRNYWRRDAERLKREVEDLRGRLAAAHKALDNANSATRNIRQQLNEANLLLHQNNQDLLKNAGSVIGAQVMRYIRHREKKGVHQRPAPKSRLTRTA